MTKAEPVTVHPLDDAAKRRFAEALGRALARQEFRQAIDEADARQPDEEARPTPKRRREVTP